MSVYILCHLQCLSHVVIPNVVKQLLLDDFEGWGVCARGTQGNLSYRLIARCRNDHRVGF